MSLESQSIGAVPLVSVLMPVFNTGKYLRPALASIAAQTYRNFELLVLDDGSTDGSIDILRGFAKDEPRMRIVSRANRGLIATRNELLSIANGELVAWMDSDDISTPDRLKRQVEQFQAVLGLVCVGTFAQRVDASGQPLEVEKYPLDHLEVLHVQRSGGAMRFPTTMMRRQSVVDVGGFREPFKMGEDFDLLLRLSEVGGMSNIAEALYLYRVHSTSVTSANQQNWIVYRDKILELAEQRRTGLDQLQRGETLVLQLASAFSPRKLRARIACEWAENTQADPLRSCLYAVRAAAISPFDRRAWRLIIKSLLAWMKLRPIL